MDDHSLAFKSNSTRSTTSHLLSVIGVKIFFLNKFFYQKDASRINCPAAELRGIKIQNLFPCCHSCESRNPVYIGSLFSQGQVWNPTFVGMTDEVNLLLKTTWNYQFKTIKH